MTKVPYGLNKDKFCTYIFMYNSHNTCHMKSCMIKVSFNMMQVPYNIGRCHIAFININIFIFIYVQQSHQISYAKLYDQSAI